MPWLHVVLVVKAVRVEPKIIDLKIIEPRPQKSWIVMMQDSKSVAVVYVWMCGPATGTALRTSQVAG